MHKLKARNLFSILGTSIISTEFYRDKAMSILKPFMEEVSLRSIIKKTCVNFYKKVEFIQIRLKSQLKIRTSKIDVLLMYWDKLFSQI